MKKETLMISFLGMVIALCGLYFLVTDYLYEEMDLVDWASDLILIIGGIVTITLFKVGLKASIASSLFALSASMLIISLPQMFSDDPRVYILAIVFVVSSIVIIYYSISIIVVTAPSSMKAIILVALMAVADFLPFLLEVHNGMFILNAIMTYSDNLVRTLMYGTLVFILTRKGIMLDSSVKRLRKNSEVVYSAFCTDPESYINRYGVRTLMTQDDVGWIHLESGPIEMERVIPLFSRNQVTEILLQRWKGDPKLHLTIRNRRAYSYTIIMSFVVEKIVLNGDDIASSNRVRLYGSDGLFIDINVMDPYERKMGYIEIIRWKRQQKKNKKYASIVDHDRKEFY